ncbi:T-cell receptor-associated transmembrane adapter 1 isoform X1 [Herpailurus yagouaroundi]|uniref:T-cell receptor-associated transmembrane adapter 1 isoform X1 n=1 Tax=Herpailurus yagouaroundi TaxID=1608482 RepID=UPI001AD6A1D3|nr:T-cell receptor-associated transmembrane adapter 1 isoform X1 [Puma yagouaroundi]
MPENPGCHYYVWVILAFLGLALIVSLIFNISHYVEKQRQGKMYRCTEDYIPREDEYYIEDTPIYGNLDDVVPEPVDENCYEQMKARPERSANELQKATAPAQTTEEAQVFYSLVDHNSERKRRKPKKQNTDLSHKDEETQLCAADAILSNTTSVDNFPFESQEVEENVHDDPIRLFGLIRAKREPINSLDYDIAQ